MKRTLIFAGAALLIVAALALVYGSGGLAWLGISPYRTADTGDEPAVDTGLAVRPVGLAGPREVAAIGRLEPAGGVLVIGEALGDRLATLDVDEGSIVEKDGLLATLESRKLRQLEIESLDAQIKEAEARRTAEENLAEARIEAAKLNLRKAESHELEEQAQEKQVALYAANLALERKNLARYENLSTNLVSVQERERQGLIVQKSEAELTAAETTLARLKQSGEFGLALAQGDLDAAVAAKTQVVSAIPVESLKKARELARLNYERTAILAPGKGTVLKIHARPGEVLARKPILQMADLDEMVCVAEVYETDVRQLTLGQTAVIKSPALGPEAKDGLRGSIVRIGQLIATPELRSLDPFARADRRVVDVRIELDRASSRVAAGLVNLQVDVTFESPRSALTRGAEE